MANPRKLPTIADYLAWARSQGCAVERPSCLASGPYQIVRLSTPAGQVAIEVYLDDDDPLASTTIARLDRRLGIKSYLFV